MAAVMRAMTFGLTDGGLSRDDGGERGRARPSSRQEGGGGSTARSSSKTGGVLARSLSRGFGGGDDDVDSGDEGSTIGESLSRTSSRMTPMASILLKLTCFNSYPAPSIPCIDCLQTHSPNRPSPLPSPSTSPSNPSHLHVLAPSTSFSAIDLSRSTSSPAGLASAPPASSGLSASRPTGQLQRQASNLSTTSTTSFQQPPVTPIQGHFSHSAASATPTSGAAYSPATALKEQQKREATIRFAPLPEIRPRSYSTGHNVWLEDDPEFDPESGELVEGYFEGVEPVEGPGGEVIAKRRLVRRDDVERGDYALGDDDDDHRPGSAGGGIKWGSWTEAFIPGSLGRKLDEDAVSMTSSNGGPSTTLNGLERTTSRTSSLGGASSYSAGGGSNGVAGGGSGGSKKLLKALGFGKSSKKKKGGGDEGDLARISSVDSTVTHSTTSADALSRRSSIDTGALASPSSLRPPPRPKGTTGIPMRKASTWEPGDAAVATARNSAGAPVYYASPARSARKRANYPPVAQRSRNSTAGGGRNARLFEALKVEEPEFSEWGPMAGTGAVGRGVGSGGGGAGAGGGGRKGAGGRMMAAREGGEDEDDGSGMAWIKKRRAEREKKAKEEQEAAAAAAAAAAAEADQSADSPDGPEETAPPGTAADSPPSLASSASSGRRNFSSSLRKPPTRSGTLDSTTSTGSNATVRPSTPHAQSQSQSQTQSGATTPSSGLAATRPLLSVDVVAQRVAKVAGGESSSAEEEEDDADTPATTPMSAVSSASMADEEEAEVEGEEEEEEDEEDDDENDQEEEEDEDEDDDLDEEELAREEALAEEAKRGAKAMGAERYHSASHENRLLQVSDGDKAPKASPRLTA
ncbi:hypothetical protein JCM11251_000204 [Rhodosporidiobolus azoricus]